MRRGRESTDAVLGVVGPRGVMRMLARLRARDSSARPILLVPEIDAWRFADGNVEVWPTGEEHLELDPEDLSRRLLSAGVSRILVPLGLPRRQLIWVARWAAAERRLGFSLTCGSRRLESRPAVVLSLLALTALVRVPLSVALRLGRWLDGLLVIASARLAGALPRRRIETGTGVCHVITHVGTGGAQRQLLEYLSWKARRRETEGLRVVALFTGNRAFLAALRSTGVAVDVVQDFFEQNALRRAVLALFPHVSAIAGLWRLTRSTSPRCVYAWLFVANVSTGIAGRLAGVPRIVASELSLSGWKRGYQGGRWWYRAADRAAARLWDAVVANSRAAAEDFASWVSLPRDTIHVIHNGIDLQALRSSPVRDVRRLLGIPPARRVVLTVGRLAPEKNLTLLLRSVARLRDSGMGLTLVIVGHGAEGDTLKRLAQELGIASQVMFVGGVRDPESFYRAADLFMLTSSRESLPNVIIEAQAFGLPVVTTDVGGVRELVEDGVTGIVLSHLEPEALAGAIRRVLEDPGLAQRLGLAGRARVEGEFSVGEMGRRIDAIVAEENAASD